MDTIQRKHELSIVEICDTLIEDAQTIFMNQTNHTKEITLNLRDYPAYYADDEEQTKKINKEIKNNLMAQQIRLYEDECDENGIITSSKEHYSNIFEDVMFAFDKKETYINLFFSKAMIDLLT